MTAMIGQLCTMMKAFLLSIGTHVTEASPNNTTYASNFTENIFLFYTGNRGITFEYWTSTTKSMSDIDDVLSMTDSDAGYTSEFLDETFYEDVNDTLDNYVSRMTTFFSPPHDGVYQFQLMADDGAKLFINGVCVFF